MSRVFGWDLPPGVTHRMIDPPDVKCEVCGEYTDNCICPECQTCQASGDPKCYVEHGLKRTKQQLLGAAQTRLSELEDCIAEEQQHIDWLKARPDDYAE